MTAAPLRLSSRAAGRGDIGDLVTAMELRVLAEITYRQVDYWCRVGLLHEAIVPEGSGTARAFTADEVRVACAFGRLSLNSLGTAGGRRGGTFNPLAALVAEHVREHGLHGTVTSEDGVVVVNLDAIPDPMKGR